MMSRTLRSPLRFVALLLPVLAAACSTEHSYPSLAVRDVERINGSAAPAQSDAQAAAPALPPASADLETRLRGLVAVARDADEKFQAQRGAAERAVAAAGGEGTDSWSSASVALGVLEGSRSQAMISLAELDTMYTDARDAVPTEESPTARAIGEARTQVSDWVAAQDRVLDRLGGKLKG